MAITQEHSKLIFEHYESGDLDWLAKQVNKKKHAIEEWANKRGLVRKINIRRNGSLEPLLSGTLQSFYWLDFIAADGYIHKNGHLMVSQVEKDKDTIFRFAKFLNTSVYEFEQTTTFCKCKQYRVNICDIKIGRDIRKLFNIQDHLPKTYTGISLDFITNEDQAAAFLSGFIDGDGHLDKHSTYIIQCDKSWFDTFKILLSKLPKNMQNVYLALIYRKDRDKEFLNFYLRKSASNALVEFVKFNNLECSKRKFP